MSLLTSPFLVVRLCPISRVLSVVFWWKNDDSGDTNSTYFQLMQGK